MCFCNFECWILFCERQITTQFLEGDILSLVFVIPVFIVPSLSFILLYNIGWFFFLALTFPVLPSIIYRYHLIRTDMHNNYSTLSWASLIPYVHMYVLSPRFHTKILYKFLFCSCVPHSLSLFSAFIICLILYREYQVWSSSLLRNFLHHPVIIPQMSA